MAKVGSLGNSVVDTRIWGCERAYARSHPQIRPPFTANPGEPKSLDKSEQLYEIITQRLHNLLFPGDSLSRNSDKVSQFQQEAFFVEPPGIRRAIMSGDAYLGEPFNCCDQTFRHILVKK